MNIIEALKQDRTIPELCKLLEIDNEFDMISEIGDLEASGKVCLKGFYKFYQPNGCVGFIAKYGLVPI